MLSSASLSPKGRLVKRSIHIRTLMGIRVSSAAVGYTVPEYVSIVYLKIYVKSVLAMTSANVSITRTKLITFPISSRPTILIRCDLVPMYEMLTIDEMATDR